MPQKYGVELFNWYNNMFKPNYTTYLNKVGELKIRSSNVIMNLIILVFLFFLSAEKSKLAWKEQRFWNNKDKKNKNDDEKDGGDNDDVGHVDDGGILRACK